jgi:tetratricopeptide (TPR) repeat protein
VATAAVSSGTEEAIRRSHPARVALLFAAASAGVLGLVWMLVHRLGLPDWVLTGAVVLLLIGLPIMLVTGSIERRRARARASGRVATTPASGLQDWLTWRKAVRGGVLAFAGLGLATVAYTAMRALGIGPVGTLVASGRLSERDRLIVADFENRTADSSLGTSVSEAFRIDLAQTPLVRILSSAEVGDALTRMRRDPATPVTLALAREIATREGAKAIVAGEISALGKSYVVSARILGADGSELVALRETAEDDARIVGALDRLSAKLRERIGESLTSIRAGAPLDQVTTSSLEALRLYTEGARLSDQGYERQAVDRLEQAIALDSGFAMAWRKLAVAQGNASGSEERVVAATTRAWQHRERLTEVERLLTEGYYHSRVEVDPAKEEAAYRRILAINPDNETAANNLSLLLSRLGRPEEAESVITPALRASASPDNMMLQLLLAQVLQEHDAEARRTLDTMAAIGPDLAMYVWARGIALGAMGDYDGAERAFLDLERRADEADLGDVSDAHQGLARVARIRGRLAEADRHTRLDMDVSARRGLPGTVLQGAADLARAELTYRGDSAGAVRILETALADHPLDSVPALDRPDAHVAMVYALAGRKEQARQLLSAYESQVPEGVRRGRWEWYLAKGWLALAEGRPREAAGNFLQGRHSDDCYFCGGWDEGVAYERAGMADSALAAYERAVGRGGPWRMRVSQWGLGPSLKRLGELHEARGDRARALGYYGRFVELWKDADPVLQPAVREVRGRMAALAGEGE